MWLVSIEVWRDRMILTWVRPATPRSTRSSEHAESDAPAPPERLSRWGLEPKSLVFQLSDDVGTVYPMGTGGAGSRGAELRGEVEFRATPPPTATELQIRRNGLGDEVSVALGDK
jgi:hypothetical protein